MIIGYNDTIMDRLNEIIHDIDDYFNLTYTPRPEFYSLQQRSLFEAIMPSVVSSGVGAQSSVGSFTTWAGLSQFNMWNGTCNSSIFNTQVPTYTLTSLNSGQHRLGHGWGAVPACPGT